MNNFGTKTGKVPDSTDILHKRDYTRCKGYKSPCGRHINSKPYYSELRQKYCATCVEIINQEEADNIMKARN